MKHRLTKEQALATGNNQDIIEYILWENGINPETLTSEEYQRLVKKIYEISLAEQN